MVRLEGFGLSSHFVRCRAASSFAYASVRSFESPGICHRHIPFNPVSFTFQYCNKFWYAWRDSVFRLTSFAAEPRAPSLTLQSALSNPWEYATGIFPLIQLALLFNIAINFGTPGGIRTPDARIRSPTLYPTELQAHKIKWGEKRVSNPRPQEPQSCALAN